VNDILSQLPVSDKPNECKNCSHDDWNMARTDSEGYVIMCNKCEGVPEDWDPTMELN
jgi:hypothetical protein